MPDEKSQQQGPQERPLPQLPKELWGLISAFAGTARTLFARSGDKRLDEEHLGNIRTWLDKRSILMLSDISGLLETANHISKSRHDLIQEAFRLITDRLPSVRQEDRIDAVRVVRLAILANDIKLRASAMQSLARAIEFLDDEDRLREIEAISVAIDELDVISQLAVQAALIPYANPDMRDFAWRSVRQRLESAPPATPSSRSSVLMELANQIGELSPIGGLSAFHYILNAAKKMDSAAEKAGILKQLTNQIRWLGDQDEKKTAFVEILMLIHELEPPQRRIPLLVELSGQLESLYGENKTLCFDALLTATETTQPSPQKDSVFERLADQLSQLPAEAPKAMLCARLFAAAGDLSPERVSLLSQFVENNYLDSDGFAVFFPKLLKAAEALGPSPQKDAILTRLIQQIAGYPAEHRVMAFEKLLDAAAENAELLQHLAPQIRFLPLYEDKNRAFHAICEVLNNRPNRCDILSKLIPVLPSLSEGDVVQAFHRIGYLIHKLPPSRDEPMTLVNALHEQIYRCRPFIRDALRDAVNMSMSRERESPAFREINLENTQRASASICCLPRL